MDELLVKMVFVCSVKGCKTEGKNGFHSFPSNILAAERWVRAIQAWNLVDRLKANKVSHSFYKVCRKHFKDTDFQLNGKGQIVVKADSTPSLFLPDDVSFQQIAYFLG